MTASDTRELLARHHRDGAHFAQLMKDSFAERASPAFWAEWDRWIGPVLPARPVVLDLGAGPGMFVAAVAARHPGAQVTGIECAPYMLEAAVPMPQGCRLLDIDLHDPRLPFEDGTVDAAHAAVVIHEMHQPVKALREVLRCLKPGGRLYLSDWVRTPLPQYLEAQGWTDEAFDAATGAERLEDIFVHFIEHNRFSTDDLVYVLERVGYRIVHREVVRDGRMARLVAERPV